MAEEITTDAQEVEADQTEKDWKAEYEKMRDHMRGWEKKAKANQGAADELEKLKSAQMTEQEKAIARAEAAESELAAIKAKQARTDAAMRIANSTGVPIEMLLYCSDEEAMTEFAKTYGQVAHVSSAPSALGGTRIIRGNDTPKSNGELFAELTQNLMN